jgi:hypothetical protein
MKLNLLLLTLATSISSFTYGQTQECDCSGPLSKDLKSLTNQTEYSNFKDWLYTYYQSDETTRSSLKSSASSSWSGHFKAVIESVPVGGGAGGGSSSSKDNQKYYRLEQSYLRNRYISNEELNELFVEEFSENQLIAYTECLKYCGSSENGVKMFTGKDTRDEFYIQVQFKSVPAGGVLTLFGNAVSINMEPIGILIFKDSLKIKDGQTITQYFKRLDLSKQASFTFNTKEGVKMPVIELSAKPSINQEAMPIGTIIASVLDYSTFLKVNNLDEINNKDMAAALWIPCDGRTLTVSKYAKYSGGKIPDLRGVFLRGINDYGVSFSTVEPVSDSQKNPDNNVAGQLQSDAFQGHRHGWRGDKTAHIPGGGNDYATQTNSGASVGQNWSDNAGSLILDPTTDGVNGAVRISSETRPKNRTVYYYIKIN